MSSLHQGMGHSSHLITFNACNDLEIALAPVASGAQEQALECLPFHLIVVTVSRHVC